MILTRTQRLSILLIVTVAPVVLLDEEEEEKARAKRYRAKRREIWKRKREERLRKVLENGSETENEEILKNHH